MSGSGAIDLAERVCLITGGASGIGAAGALHFARAGARVVIADRDAAAGAEVAREIGGVALTVDVADEHAVDALVACTLDPRAACSRMPSAARTCTAWGVDSLMFRRSVVTASAAACCSVPIATSTACRRAARYASRKAGSRSHRRSVDSPTPMLFAAFADGSRHQSE